MLWKSPMNKLLTIAGLAVTVFLNGCGVDAQASCEAYVVAVNDCTAEAMGVTDGTYDVDAEATCAAYGDLKGSAASSQADYYDCYAAAYNDADCSTAEGLAAVDLTGCVLE
jgi:hypothetical protein